MIYCVGSKQRELRENIFELSLCLVRFSKEFILHCSNYIWNCNNYLVPWRSHSRSTRTTSRRNSTRMKTRNPPSTSPSNSSLTSRTPSMRCAIKRTSLAGRCRRWKRCVCPRSLAANKCRRFHRTAWRIVDCCSTPWTHFPSKLIASHWQFNLDETFSPQNHVVVLGKD